MFICDTSRSANGEIQGKGRFCRTLSTKEQINLRRTQSLCALRNVLMVEAAAWERKDKISDLSTPLTPFFFIVLRSLNEDLHRFEAVTT